MTNDLEKALLQELLRIKQEYRGKEAKLSIEDAGFYERGLQLHRQQTKAPVLRESIKRYLAAKSDLCNRSRAEYGTYLRKVLRLTSSLSEKSLGEISSVQWKEVLQQIYPTVAGRNKARRLLHGLYAFAIKQDWVPHNPLDAFPPENTEERHVRILQPIQLKKLRQELLKPMFAGIAPAIGFMLWEGERVNRLKHMQWQEIRLHELSPILQKWLNLFPKHYHGSLIPGNWITAWRKLRSNIGINDWQNETLFHTYVVYHLSYFRNPESLMKKHRNLKKAVIDQRYRDFSNIHYEDAADYWNADW